MSIISLSTCPIPTSLSSGVLSIPIYPFEYWNQYHTHIPLYLSETIGQFLLSIYLSFDHESNSENPDYPDEPDEQQPYIVDLIHVPSSIDSNSSVSSVSSEDSDQHSNASDFEEDQDQQYAEDDPGYWSKPPHRSVFNSNQCQCRQARISKLRQYHSVIIEEPMENYVIPYETKKRSGQRRVKQHKRTALPTILDIPASIHVQWTQWVQPYDYLSSLSSSYQSSNAPHHLAILRISLRRSQLISRREIHQPTSSYDSFQWVNEPVPSSQPSSDPSGQPTLIYSVRLPNNHQRAHPSDQSEYATSQSPEPPTFVQRCVHQQRPTLNLRIVLLYHFSRQPSFVMTVSRRIFIQPSSCPPRSRLPGTIIQQIQLINPMSEK